MSETPLNQKIDHTLLKADATRAELEKLCQEAKKYHFYSVCVAPHHVQLAREFLSGSSVKLCSVVGFPLGSSLSDTKAFEAKKLSEMGVHEIDMVINIAAIKDGNDLAAQEDIEAVMRAAPHCLIKVIIESGILSPAEIVRASEIVVKAGAPFVKTSTGFAKEGAKLSDVELIRKTVGALTQIKASGGIKDLATAEAMIVAGAKRLGCSQSVLILEEWKSSQQKAEKV